LLLAATVQSIAHMPLGISDRNNIISPVNVKQILQVKCWHALETCNDSVWYSTSFNAEYLRY